MFDAYHDPAFAGEYFSDIHDHVPTMEDELKTKFDSFDTGTFGTDLNTANVPPAPPYMGTASVPRNPDSVNAETWAQPTPGPDGKGVSVPGWNPTGYPTRLVEAGQQLWDSGMGPDPSQPAPPAPPVQLVPLPQPDPSYSGEVDNRIAHLQHAHRRLKEYLSGDKNVHDTRIDVCNGRPCIKVYATAKLTHRVPTSVRGVPVLHVKGKPAARRPGFGADPSTPSELQNLVGGSMGIGIAGGVMGTVAAGAGLYALGGKTLLMAAPLAGLLLGIPVTMFLSSLKS